MKRSIILLLVLLPIVAFSQMQNIINQGNTATTQRRVGGNNTIDSSLIKIRSIDAHRLLVSMPDSSSIQTVFSYSTMGTNATTLLTFPNLKIYDFKILAGNIYFCGQDINGVGFIAWMTISNLLSLNPVSFTVQLITNPFKLREVTELEVYKWDDGIHVVALGDTRYLIDMNTSNPSTYQIMRLNTPNPFRALSVGDTKIVTISRDSDTSTVVTAFDKGNIQQYIHRGFTHPQLRYDKYVLENSMVNTDIFTFAYTHRLVTNNTWYKTDFATFDATAGINIINSQYIELSDAKLEPIDLEYCPEDTTLLYLTNGHKGYDEIFQIDPFAQNNYITTIIQPNPLVISKIKQYNSIIRYDNYYFAVFAKNSNSQEGLIFDCQRNSSAQFGCANIFNELVYNINYLNNTLPNVIYSFYLGQQVPILLKHSYAPDSNQIICQ